MQSDNDTRDSVAWGSSLRRYLRDLNAAIFLLAWTAGYFDAISYLGLRQVFTANMTGNTVLLGLAIGGGDAAAVLRSTVALGGFCLGVLVGALLTGHNRGHATWTPRMTVATVVEGIVLLIFAVTWLLVGTKPQGMMVSALIMLAALAMGLQSAVTKSIGIEGISTTYITGTITSLMAEVAQRIGLGKHASLATKHAVEVQANPQRLGLQATIWIIYAFAAIIGGGALLLFRQVAVFLPLAALVLIVLDSLRVQVFPKREETGGRL